MLFRRAIATAALLAVSLGAGGLPAFAQSTVVRATGECDSAVQAKVRRQQETIGRIEFLGRPSVKHISNAETAVNGYGQFQTRRGMSKFSYHCIYNLREGRVTTDSIKYGSNNRGSASYNSGRDSSMSTGDAVGTIVGIAIAGAILNSMDKNGDSYNSDRGWWSPENGISCNSYQSACYKDGRFNAKWTNRIYR